MSEVVKAPRLDVILLRISPSQKKFFKASHIHLLHAHIWSTTAPGITVTTAPGITVTTAPGITVTTAPGITVTTGPNNNYYR